MALTDDEYSCLMIMAEGQNLIRMKGTRWEKPLTSLHAKRYCRPIGSDNFVITDLGRAVCAEREHEDDAAIDDMLRKSIGVNNARHQYLASMKTAVDAVVLAAKAASVGTGDSFSAAIDKILAEIKEETKRALQ